MTESFPTTTWPTAMRLSTCRRAKCSSRPLNRRSTAGRCLISPSATTGSIYDLTLDIVDGRASLVGARQGAREFERTLAYAQGEKDRIGEFAVGLNPGVDRFTGYALTDEKRRGTVHLAWATTACSAGTIPRRYIGICSWRTDGAGGRRPLVEAGRLRCGFERAAVAAVGPDKAKNGAVAVADGPGDGLPFPGTQKPRRCESRGPCRITR